MNELAIEIFVEGGTDGFSFYEDGGQKQASPKFLTTKTGTPFLPNTSYYFYAEHPERAPEPRLIRIFFDASGRQVVQSVEESRPAVGLDKLDDISLRTDFSVEAENPDGVLMSVLTSVGYVLRRFTPASFRQWLGISLANLTGYVTPNAITTGGYIRSTEPASLDNPGFITAWFQSNGSWALEKVTMARLRLQLNIPVIPDPTYVPPVGEQMDEFLLAQGIRRRGGLAPIPLEPDHVSWLGWQLWPYLGFGPLVPPPDGYEKLVDDDTAAGIAKQIGGVWGIDIPLTDVMPRIVLEYAEVLVLAEQLHTEYGYERAKPLTILEQIDELDDDSREAIRVKLNVLAPTFMDLFRATTEAERLEIRSIIPCCEDEDEGDDIVIEVLGHFEPVAAPPVNQAPVVSNAQANVNVTQAGAYSFALPADQFTDPDGDTLAITVTTVSGGALPAGYSYNATNRTLTVAADFSATVNTRVTATDPGGLSVNNDFTLTVNRPTMPVIESIRKKVINNNWMLYIQTNPMSTAGNNSPGIYYRIKTANGGINDNGFVPASWDANYNAAGGNEPSSNGDPNFDNNIYSAAERSAGYYGLIYGNTRNYGGNDSDNQHDVMVELSMSANGSNAVPVSFTITEGMNESISTIYTRSV
jgi:hypothetical protein